MDSIHAVLKAHALDVGDVLVFKIGRLGGITKLKQVFSPFVSSSNTDEHKNVSQTENLKEILHTNGNQLKGQGKL